MTVTRATARTAEYLLTQHGTAAAGAYQCSVQLRAIKPYTDRQLSAVRHLLEVLAQLEDRDPEKAGRWRTAIRDIAQVPA